MAMTEEQALRAAVVAQPDDDLPRLAFADFLDDAGSTMHAQWIREQVALAGQPCTAPANMIFHRRFSGRSPHEPALIFPHDGTPTHCCTLHPGFATRRGFAYGMHATVQPQLTKELRHLLTVEPIALLALGSGNAEQLEEIAALPEMKRLHRLSFEGLSLPIETLRVLRESPHLCGVTSLLFQHGNSPAWPAMLQDLMDSTLGQQLTEISASFGMADNAEEMFEVLSTAQLDSLSLRDFAIHAQATRGTAFQQTIQRLHTLKLPGNGLADIGTEALTAACQRLEVLDLSHNQLTEHAVTALVACPGFHSLRHLNLSGNRLGFEALRRLVRHDRWPRLQVLDLANTQCDDASVRAITGSPVWPNLVAIDLLGNPIAERGVERLIHAPLPRDLVWLRLTSRFLNRTSEAKLQKHFGAALVLAA
jgi:uncharacterized protein (TIGR02996 family)